MSNQPPSFENAAISDHALEQMAARGISIDILNAVLRHPDSVAPVRSGRVVVQKIVGFGQPERDYLVRVFIDVDRQHPEVVTAYRTSKIRKYTDQQ